MTALHHQTIADQPVLQETIGRTLIIAYRETTERLEQALTATGLPCQVLRQPDCPEYANYASIYRCLLNHQQAWTLAAQATQPTLIVEADFVPVRTLGQLPLPFRFNQADVGIAWIYTCAPQLYSVTREGFGEGYSVSTVAYIVTPLAAAALCEFVAEVTQQHGTDYFNFDSYLDSFLRRRGFKNYIAFRNYGEHGGRGNPEHRRNGMSGLHRADVLAGQLAFLPDYVPQTRSAALILRLSRTQARLKGIARLLLGKFVRPKVLRHSSVPGRMIRFALGRQCAITL